MQMNSILFPFLSFAPHLPRLLSKKGSVTCPRAPSLTFTHHRRSSHRHPRRHGRHRRHHPPRRLCLGRFRQDHRRRRRWRRCYHLSFAFSSLSLVFSRSLSWCNTRLRRVHTLVFARARVRYSAWARAKRNRTRMRTRTRVCVRERR